MEGGGGGGVCFWGAAGVFYGAFVHDKMSRAAIAPCGGKLRKEDWMAAVQARRGAPPEADASAEGYAGLTGLLAEE